MTRRDVCAGRIRLRGDRGAVLAEMGLVMPIFIVIVFGIIEFGGLFRDYLTVSNASSSGGRAAAIAGNSLDADFRTLTAIRKGASAMPRSQITTIVIYHATNSTSPVPTSCKTSASSGSGSPNWTNACNIYTGAALNTLVTGNFGCGGSQPDRFWCPSNRKTKLTGAQSPPDYVGIWMQAEHPWVTGLFGANITFDYTTVVKLEPQARA